MAGSYGHITDDAGRFTGIDCIDNLGDAYEALEECYGMIQFLTGGDETRIAAAIQQSSAWGRWARLAEGH